MPCETTGGYPCGYPACIRFVFGDLPAGIRKTVRTGEDRLQAERRAAEHAQVMDVSENHHPNNQVALLGYVWIIFPFISLTIVVGELVYICKYQISSYWSSGFYPYFGSLNIEINKSILTRSPNTTRKLKQRSKRVRGVQSSWVSSNRGSNFHDQKGGLEGLREPLKGALQNRDLEIYSIENSMYFHYFPFIGQLFLCENHPAPGTVCQGKHQGLKIEEAYRAGHLRECLGRS